MGTPRNLATANTSQSLIDPSPIKKPGSPAGLLRRTLPCGMFLRLHSRLAELHFRMRLWGCAQHTLDEINKRLATGASQRGQVAHYGMDFEIIKTGPRPLHLDLGPPRLKPSRYNRVAELQGKTASPKHTISTADLTSYIIGFEALQKDLESFTKKMALPPPRQGEGLLS